MATTGAELFVETLSQYGVNYIVGNPGTTELPVVHAIADSDIEYVLGLHEDIAVGIAGGYGEHATLPRNAGEHHSRRYRDPPARGCEPPSQRRARPRAG